MIERRRKACQPLFYNSPYQEQNKEQHRVYHALNPVVHDEPPERALILTQPAEAYGWLNLASTTNGNMMASASSGAP
jgi:hypothetical protein